MRCCVAVGRRTRCPRVPRFSSKGSRPRMVRIVPMAATSRSRMARSCSSGLPARARRTNVPRSNVWANEGRALRPLLRRGFDESLEDRSELAGAIEVLGVPLHAEAESTARILDRFNHAIGCSGGHRQTRSEFLWGLMMTAVHHARVTFEKLVHQAIEQGSFRDPYLVRDRDG